MFIMETKKKRDNLILKKWINANGNGNGNGNDNSHDHHHDRGSFIIYKSFHAGEKPHFSVGDSWTVSIEGVISSFKVVAIEDIIIPAGKYKCFKISEEINGFGAKNYYWFASNVGLIKCEIGRVTVVLQNYSS